MRPIFQGIQNWTHKESRLIVDYLHPYVDGLYSCLKDTIHPLMILDNLHVDEEATLVFIDVEALYSNNFHSSGINMVLPFLKQRSAEFTLYNNLVFELLEFILTHNEFMFDGSHYLQVQGEAMGTTCALLYANLYLGGWE